MDIELRNCSLEINYIGTPEAIFTEMIFRGVTIACQKMAAFFEEFKNALDVAIKQLVDFGMTIMKALGTTYGTVRWHLDNDTMNWVDTIPEDKTPSISERKIWKMTQMRNPRGLR